MAQARLDDVEVFLTVAREGSFTRAAALLGVSQSALSQTVRSLEARIGIRLLDRTTRSVAPTEAGARLLERVSPHLVEVRAEIAAVNMCSKTGPQEPFALQPTNTGQQPHFGPDFLRC